MTGKKKRVAPTRNTERTRKAAKLAEVLKTDSPPSTASVVEESSEVEQFPGDSSEESTSDRISRLKKEARLLRDKLVSKTEELRALSGSNDSSQRVWHVLDLLSKPGGATKSVLVAESGAKKGYIDALLSRILPARGFVVVATAEEGKREKSYSIARSS